MSRLPALGRRGEGWFVVQLALMALVALAGWLLGPDWHGMLLIASIAAGSALVAAGVVAGVLGTAVLGNSLSPWPHPPPGGQLVETGIYGYVRHPIYLGVMLAAVGWALVSASVVAMLLAGLLVAFLDLKARREEAWLRQRYPGYAGYAHRVRRFLPGLY